MSEVPEFNQTRAVAEGRRAEFIELFEEFASSYPHTLEGQEHIRTYEAGRKQGRQNFQEIEVAVNAGQNVTDAVLLNLLPHYNNPSNVHREAWIHIAPAVQGNIKRWFEGKKWREPEDWPEVAQQLFYFFWRCKEEPAELPAACEEFASSPYSKGFQMGLVTPMLNALRPDSFMLVNAKVRETINHFSAQKYGRNLLEYPKLNALGLAMVQDVEHMTEAASLSELRSSDRLDMFSHWLVGVKQYGFESTSYWKIAPGEKAWQWPECRDGNFIAIGWEGLGDVSSMARAEFEERRDELIAEHPDWTKARLEQVWTFSRIQEADRIVANRGISEVLGIGTVTGPYEFHPSIRHGHRLPVDWGDTQTRQVSEGNWRRTLLNLSPQKFQELRDAPLQDGQEPEYTGATEPSSPFSYQTFKLLGALHETPTKSFYEANKEDFRQYLEEPFQNLFREIAGRLPSRISEVMETKIRLFARILKNDYGKGGAWDFYWGAFYPKGGKRTTGAQLSMWIDRDRLEFGFYIGDYGSEQRKQFLENCADSTETLYEILQDSFEDGGLVFGEHKSDYPAISPATWEEWLDAPEKLGLDVSLVVPREEVLRSSSDQLVSRAVDVYRRLFPLVLLATEEDALTAIGDYLELAEEKPLNPVYSLEECAEDTGFDLQTLAKWTRGINRKGQAILYGPPGTGKTFMAEHLARHLVGGKDGFWDLVQFHPAYAYEDFVQGIRPQSSDGKLSYPLVEGRFLEFCKEARSREGECVLIIDEINRADLSRVFGELMYLLEYREEEVPLAGGRKFSIPENVRVVGTMNTADRSLALVDHALRRRFAFLALYPDYGLLRHYHAGTGFDLDDLISVLETVNAEIDDPHYQLGVSFFMTGKLDQELGDIWSTEIEPYLEEYFFDRPERAKQFAWQNVSPQIGSQYE